MWQHRDSLRRSPGLRCWFLTTSLLLALAALPGVAQPPEDPVEALQQALTLRLEDTINPPPTMLEFREKTLQKRINQIKKLGDLRRALALEDWKTQLKIDMAMRKLVADRFVLGVKRVIKEGSPTAKMAVANLIAEIGPTIRAVEVDGAEKREDKSGFARSLTPEVIELTQDANLEVQQEALRALGNINPRPMEAFKVFSRALEQDKLGPRRQAASALGQMVRVVGFLQKRGKTAAGIESSPAEMLEVAQAAAAGAGYGLNDPDPKVRELCLQAVDEAARAVAEQVPEPEPRKNFPPEGRTLTDDEKKEIKAYQEKVLAEQQKLAGVFKAFQKEGARIARELHAAEPAVAAEAASALDDIASARIKLIRLVMSAPLVSKDEAMELRKGLREIDPMAFFLQDDHLQAISALIKAPSPRLRRLALQILEDLTVDALPALPAIAEALGDRDRFVVWSAARAIGNIGPRQAVFAVPGLARLLCFDDNNVRLAAAATLEAMGSLAREAMPAVKMAVTTGDAETRVAACYVVLSIGPEFAGPAIPGLIESLTADDPRVRRTAAEVLGKLGSVAEAAVPALRRALEDEDQEVRINASEAILSILTPPLE
jgi:HEAT repeat protein